MAERATDHLRTNAKVIEQITGRHIEIAPASPDGSEGGPVLVTVHEWPE